MNEIYAAIPPGSPLEQGEIIDACPIVDWRSGGGEPEEWKPAEFSMRAIVLTQACDLANAKSTRIQLATVHLAEKMVAHNIIKAQTIRDQIRRHKVYGWYFLPACEWLPESIIDLQDVHTIPRRLLEQTAADGHRVCRLTTPYREHLSQHFAVTYGRIGLPELYPTED